MKLWGAQFLCQMADRMFTYIIMINAFEITRTNLGTSIPPLSFGISAVVFSLFFGVLVDRWKKKSILLSSNLLRTVLVLIIGSIDSVNSSLYILFAASFLVFSISQIFIPAEIATMPLIVKKRELILANSLFMGTWMISSVLGFGAAVPITYTYGIPATYKVIAILYVIAAILILTLKTQETLNAKKSSSIHTLRREFNRGWRFVVKHRVVFFAMLQMMFASLS